MEGLGNQMFQYAAGFALSQKLKTSLALDLQSYRQNLNGRTYQLHHFVLPTRHKTFNKPLLATIIRKIKRNYRLALLYHKLPKFPRLRLRNYDTFTCPLLAFEREISLGNNFGESKKYTILSGYFQNTYYFSGYENAIRKEFKLKSPLSKRSQKYLEKINKTQYSVSAHMRLGDYHKSRRLNANYYVNAIKYVQKHCKNPKFFIFSESTKEAQEFIHKQLTSLIPPEAIEYIEPADGATSYEDLFLMSSCTHNIMANSSFSWWAAFLNTTSPNITIFPKNNATLFPEEKKAIQFDGGLKEKWWTLLE